MSQLYVLHEHASGYALFRVAEFEEISIFLPQVEESIHDLSKFKSIVNLVAFQPFKTNRNGLDNFNALSEGILHPQLQLFIETNVPKPKKKKQPITLGILDVRLGPLIIETLGIPWISDDIVTEISRGVRLHFPQLIKELDTNNMSLKSGLGLSHYSSRAKVKFNISQQDNHVVQSIAIVDQLDKDINNLCMRVREWYSHHFPELIKVVPENILYVKCVNAIKNRKNLSDDIEEKLTNILMDSTKAANVVELARSSMGMEYSETDMENITYFAVRAENLSDIRKELMEYMQSKMNVVAPNLSSLIGETVGARLISHAGSLMGLAKHPASTVQILGAEKALFRAIKTRGNTPKFGLLYHSTFIGKAPKEHKGRISRFLANKCALASRVDCFAEIPNDVIGKTLKQQVEDRLKFYETGKIPPKNIDVMLNASNEAEAVQKVSLKRKRKEEKKAKKRLKLLNESTQNTTLESSLNETILDSSIIDLPEAEQDLKIKKKKLKSEKQISEENSEINLEAFSNSIENHELAKIPKNKKKKKKQSLEQNLSNHESNEVEASNLLENVEIDETEVVVSKKKKKKAAPNLNQEINEEANHVENLDLIANEEREVPITKKKKKKTAQNLIQEINEEENHAENLKFINNEEVEVPITKKKKKSKFPQNQVNQNNVAESDIVENGEIGDVSSPKKKKKRKLSQIEANQEINIEENVFSSLKKKKKLRANAKSPELNINQEALIESKPSKKGKKKLPKV